MSTRRGAAEAPTRSEDALRRGGFAERELNRRGAGHAPGARAGSALDRHIADASRQVRRLRAKDASGRWAYYVVYVHPHKERLFTAAVNGKSPMNLEDYGVVLASNFGEALSAENQRMLEERYGWRS